MPDPEKRAQEIIVGMLNVRQAEQRSTKRTARAVHPKDAETKDFEARISNALGLKVQVFDKGKKGGEVRIEYKTLEQLDEIFKRLSRNN